MNILVADDEDLIRKNFVKRIHRLNIKIDQVYEAENGIRAMQIMKMHPIHMCLLDINMPLKNGLELLDEMKQCSERTHFIIISGYDSFSYAKEAIRHGVHRYLLKPINREEFEEAVTSLYEKILSETRRPGVRESASPVMRQILDSIEQNYRDAEYNLSKLAEEIQLSESYITRLLKKEISTTFSEYLTARRIEKAKQIMCAEGAQVKLYEVAESVGYRNQHYFSQVFKKYEGQSPKEWLSEKEPASTLNWK